MSPCDYDDELAALESMSRAELRAAWKRRGSHDTAKCQRGPAASRARPSIFSPRRLGGITKAMERKLQEIADGGATRRVTPGTRFAREWHGKIHVVTVTGDGRYRWQDRRVEQPVRGCSRNHRHTLVGACVLRHQDPEARCMSQLPLRHLHPEVERGGSRARLQQSRCPARGCAAYIKSQASEGWMLVRERYDDGGISGGTLERPGLQRLLADIAAGHIDIVVVYKVDRLTRSLLDFAKLVEAFDKAGTSFVSITQSFNTTTSMGRLTLNMLLSFAQFEREVTAERIRDKIAHRKPRACGWAERRRSAIGPMAAASPLSRNTQRSSATSSLAMPSSEMSGCWPKNWSKPAFAHPRATITDRSAFGGRPFSRGQLYRMLSNPTLHRHDSIMAAARTRPIIRRSSSKNCGIRCRRFCPT